MRAGPADVGKALLYKNISRKGAKEAKAQRILCAFAFISCYSFSEGSLCVFNRCSFSEGGLCVKQKALSIERALQLILVTGPGI